MSDGSRPLVGLRQEIVMRRFMRAGLAALIITGASFIADAQVSFARDRLTTSELETLTDARITLLKAVLQLTPEQEKLWPALEDAIRFRATGRQARLARAVARAEELDNRNTVENLRNREPVEFLRRRAAALAQRSGELSRLADAWQPLYQTLSTDQRQRLGLVAVIVLRDLRDDDEDRLLRSEDEGD
jgi:hypothetical protein